MRVRVTVGMGMRGMGESEGMGMRGMGEGMGEAGDVGRHRVAVYA